ncbi:MAG: hypothetical protein E7562_03920 [Ruminococcaceae bacterium]|nr:hypothetical protein [Oscillospiraceae bacterium]
MDNRFYDNVIGEMKPFFEEHSFVSHDDGSFRNETKAFLVEYNEARQMYLLKFAEVDNGNVGEYSEVCSWLFDDSQSAKDAEAVGIDFVNTMRDNLGIKIKRPAVSDVDLPSADKNGALTVSGFAKKVLDVFPQFKDDYKAHVAHYGNFLYLNFYSKTLIPQIRTLLNEDNKKNKKKLFDLIETGYLQGDRETVNAVVTVLAAAAYKDDDMKAKVLALVEENKHLYNSVNAFIPVFASNKKLVAALIK